jgi:hypothetical protein
MKICKVCGETQEEHHIPDWLEIPAGCVCNWREWDFERLSSLPPVCDHYEGNGTQNCSRCEHDKECHVFDSRKNRLAETTKDDRP